MSFWIIVANASRARFFEAVGKDCQMREIFTLTHPNSRQHEGDLISDGAGHVMSSATGGHSMGGENAAKQHEADLFARAVCERLEQGRNKGSYAKLYLIAEPQFLGRMRQRMSKPLQNMVGDEFAKDLTMASEAQIRAQLM